MPSENQSLLNTTSNGPRATTPRYVTVGDTYEHRLKLKRRRRCVLVALWCLFFISILLTCIVVFQAEKRKKKVVDRLNSIKTSSKNVARGCEATILLMRHCEKFGLVKDSIHNQHCSYLGLERAKFISTQLFGKHWPLPALLYALSPERPKHLNFREIETLIPTSEKANVPINSNYTHAQLVELTDDVFDHLRGGELCGRVVAITWDQEALPYVAHALGCGESEGCPLTYPSTTFDDVWQLKYVYGPPIMYSSKKEGEGHVKKRHPHDEWFIYGSVTHMNFDPLKFSTKMGDYPLAGTPMGGRWASPSMSGVPEQKKKN